MRVKVGVSRACPRCKSRSARSERTGRPATPRGVSEQRARCTWLGLGLGLGLRAAMAVHLVRVRVRVRSPISDGGAPG
eukprot:scaffold68931_cov44-Phaeocystis_antarctica.AAC.3